MPTWTKETGVNGKLEIRDTGGDVEFWFKAGYSSDWHADLRFSYSANGSTTNKSIYYPTGADWKKIGERHVSKSQTVTFKLVSDTSIGGIGGPTSFSHYIKRDARPDAPSTPRLSGITDSSVVVKFSDGDNNGDAIYDREIGVDTNSSGSSKSLRSSDGNTTVGGLNDGTTYYFWARTRNSEGWSNWSGRASAKTLRKPSAPSPPLLSSVRATSVDVAFSANSDGGSDITAYQIGWDTSSAFLPETFVYASSPKVIDGLTPGTTYYFRVRARNSVGWSDWSAPTGTRTVAGAYVKVGAEWKLAVPYVNVGGVWKMAEAWSRNVGVWKRTR